MSVEAVAWALNIPVGANMKVVLIGLANHAHADGTDAYPSLDTLARYAHCDRSTARRNVRKLAEENWIVEAGEGPRGQTRWTLAMWRDPEAEVGQLDGADFPSLRECVYCGGVAHVLDHVVPKSKGGGEERNRVPACDECNTAKGVHDVREWVEASGRDWQAVERRLGRWDVEVAKRHVADREGGTGASKGVAPVPPEPSKEPSLRSSLTDRAPELAIPDEMRRDGAELIARKTKVDGKIVNVDEMVIAAAALAEFNRQSGSDYGLGAHLKPIVMRIRERPSYSADAHVRLVQSAFRIRWWDRDRERAGQRPGGRVKPNVIYGNARCFENVVQDAIDEKNNGGTGAKRYGRGRQE